MDVIKMMLPFLYALIPIISVLAIVKSLISSIKKSNVNRNIVSTIKTISQGLNEECSLPFSVPQMTAVYKPKINRDFPEMGYERMEAMARNGIVDILNAVESEKPENVANSSSRLQNRLKGIIEDYAGRGEKIHYDNVKIHASSIVNYSSSTSTATAVFQISLQSLAYRTREGSVVSGSNSRPTQNLFSVTLCYNQNIDDSGSKTFIESNCPNCGAPISAVGNRQCPYCGSGLVPVVDKIWQVDSFELLK